VGLLVLSTALLPQRLPFPSDAGNGRPSVEVIDPTAENLFPGLFAPEQKKGHRVAPKVRESLEQDGAGTKIRIDVQDELPGK
jgi:hypothetical protein